jgi:hypothetical protein
LKKIYYVIPIACVDGVPRVTSESTKRLAMLRRDLPSSPSGVYIGMGVRHLATAKLLGKKPDKLLDLLGGESLMVSEGNGGLIQILPNNTRVPFSQLGLEAKVQPIQHMLKEMPDQSIVIGDWYLLRLLNYDPVRGFPPASMHQVTKRFFGWSFKQTAENGSLPAKA